MTNITEEDARKAKESLLGAKILSEPFVVGIGIGNLDGVPAVNLYLNKKGNLTLKKGLSRDYSEFIGNVPVRYIFTGEIILAVDNSKGKDIYGLNVSEVSR